MVLYAAYGSNLHPRRLMARTPSARSHVTRALSGWKLAFRKHGSDGSAKCDIAAGTALDEVWLGIYRIDAAEMPILDAVEGVGKGYCRTTLELEGLGEVVTYRAQPEYVRDDLLPFGWYHRFVLEGARMQGFPAAYLEALAAVATQPDPDQERAQANARILGG